MVKTSKRRQSSNGTAKKQQILIKRIIADANANSDPLATFPAACLNLNLVMTSPPNNDTAATSTPTAVTIRHYRSPLPPSILNQCLDLFERNMGEMYKQSEWGLNMDEKLKELQHEDARFLIIAAWDNHDAVVDERKCNDVLVIGFAHFRFEQDKSESSAKKVVIPITYLYELQISPNYTSHGLGYKLMTLIELLSYQFHMVKIVLTVFKCNAGAMKFYLNKMKGYQVDDCSPSNFEGEENENAEYEILSKSLVGRKKI